MAEIIFYDVMPDGSRIESLKTYRDVYIERLYAGSAAMLQGSTAILAGLPEGGDYHEIEQRYNSQFIMCEQWRMLDLVTHRGGLHQEDNQFRITKVAYDKAYASMELLEIEYWSPWSTSWETTKIDVNEKNNTQLSTEWGRQRLASLEKQKEELIGNLILKSVGSGITAVTAYACPELAILVSLGAMAMEGSSGTVEGMDSFISSELGKLGVDMGNTLAADVINCAIQMNAVGGQLDAETYKLTMEWFGKGAIYEMDGEKGGAFAGLYNPERLWN